MTIKELYEWAVKHNCVDYEIEVRDCHGDYTDWVTVAIKEDIKTVLL